MSLPPRRQLALAALVGAGIIVLGMVLPGEHGEHHWWPGFWAVFGAVGCAAIVLVSKALGHLLLERPEGWYDEPGAGRDHESRRHGGEQP
jgi:peptidoglycan/LPS O-acetylase OafA/YrhL